MSVSKNKFARALFSGLTLLFLLAVIAVLIGLTGLDIFLRIRSDKLLLLGAGSAVVVLVSLGVTVNNCFYHLFAQ